METTEKVLPVTAKGNAGKNKDLLQDIMQKIDKDNIESVRFEFCDVNSVARSKTVPSRHFESKVNSGILFPVCSLTLDPAGGIVNDHIFEKYLWSDMICYPDLSTYSVLPWAQNTARIFVTPSLAGNGDQVTIDPRTLAMNQIKALAERKITLFSSFEYEFWLVNENTRNPVQTSRNMFSTVLLSKHHDFFTKLSRNFFEVGVDIELIMTELGKSMFELTMAPTFGIKAGDNAVTFRTGIKEMALQEGLIASFMTKPYEDEVSGTGHLNHSLWSLDGKTPLLADTFRPSGLSEIGEYWIAGLLSHAPALSILQAPTLNCLDRYKPGDFAPFNATWGYDNRTCAVRLKPRGQYGCFIENRIGSSASNPYISLAAMIAAGIDGIDRKLPLQEGLPFNKPAFDTRSIRPGEMLIPTDIDAALRAFLDDQCMVKALGNDFARTFEATKRHELKLMESYTKSVGNKYEWAREFLFEHL